MSADGFPEQKIDTQVPGSVEGVEGVAEDDMVPTGAAVRTKCCSCGGNKRAYITVFVLFVINLLNYMDRQTIAGTNIYFNQLAKFNFRKSEQEPIDSFPTHDISQFPNFQDFTYLCLLVM